MAARNGPARTGAARDNRRKTPAKPALLKLPSETALEHSHDVSGDVRTRFVNALLAILRDGKKLAPPSEELLNQWLLVLERCHRCLTNRKQMSHHVIAINQLRNVCEIFCGPWYIAGKNIGSRLPLIGFRMKLGSVVRAIADQFGVDQGQLIQVDSTEWERLVSVAEGGRSAADAEDSRRVMNWPTDFDELEAGTKSLYSTHREIVDRVQALSATFPDTRFAAVIASLQSRHIAASSGIAIVCLDADGGREMVARGDLPAGWSNHHDLRNHIPSFPLRSIDDLDRWITETLEPSWGDTSGFDLKTRIYTLERVIAGVSLWLRANNGWIDGHPKLCSLPRRVSQNGGPISEDRYAEQLGSFVYGLRQYLSDTQHVRDAMPFEVSSIPPGQSPIIVSAAGEQPKPIGRPPAKVECGDVNEITLGERRYQLDYEVARYLKKLIEAGDWLSSSEYERGSRPDKLRKKMPKEVSERIKVNSRKGSRWLT